MDLSFARAANMPVTVLPTQLAVLLVGVATRQAASPTARAQARFARTASDTDLLAPPSGSFHPLVAAALTKWKDE